MPKIIFTIDTEIGDRALKYFKGNALKKFILGNTSVGDYGVQFINKILTKQGFIGEYFIDIYSNEYWSNNLFIKTMLQVKKNNNLHLHTHPYTLTGNFYLNDLNYREQEKLINFGIKKFKSILKITPLAHRAGSYAANLNTLKILNNTPIKYDLSYFKSNRRCKLSFESANSIQKYKNLLEIPVTVIQVKRKLFTLTLQTKIIKMDVNYLNNYEKFINYIQAFNNNDIIIFFLHSSSLLKQNFNKFSKRYDNIEPNFALINNFKKFLRFISKKGTYNSLSISSISSTKKIETPSVLESLL